MELSSCQESIWTEVVMTIELLTWKLPGRNEENDEKLRHDSQCSGQDLNQVASKLKFTLL
jgi:hypothetical protein